MNVAPITWGWGSMELEYFKDLINFRISIEHGFFLD